MHSLPEHPVRADVERYRNRHEWWRSIAYTLALGDLAALLAAVYLGRLSHAIYYGLDPVWVLAHWWGSLAQVNLLLFLLLGTAGMAVFALKGHYARRKAFWDEMGDLAAVFALLLALNAAIAFSGKWPLSRLWLFTSWSLALILIPLLRWWIRLLLQKAGLWDRPVVIIGAGQNALEAMRALESERRLGFRVVRLLLPDSRSGVLPGSPLQNIPVCGLGPDPMVTLEALGRPHALLALEMEDWEKHQDLIRYLGLNYPDLTVAPPLRGLSLYGLEMMHFFSHEVLMLRARNNLARPGSRAIKRIFDLWAASFLVLVLAPLLLYLVWRIRKEDGGPAFFVQERVGRYGRSFPCLKFRSMVQDAEERLDTYLADDPRRAAEYARNFKLRHDPRVTRTGKFLRRTSLDELPQLFNVLRGQMSLVGPRPLLSRELERYGENVALYRQIRPGITGLWQVSGRSETTFADRANLDAWYVKNWSLWYDIVILLRTIKVVVDRNGAY